MENWDDAELDRVIAQKDSNKGAVTTTDIVCKYFLEAVETFKYGWFWECPNGGKSCKYRHRLPPGYVLKRDQVKEDDGPTISIEELVEEERAKLVGGTPVTLESFTAWKEKRRLKAKEAEEAVKKDLKTKKAAGKELAGASGRQLFDVNPELFVDDDAAADEYVREASDDEDDAGEPNKAAAKDAPAAGDAAPSAAPVAVDKALFDEAADDLDGLDLEDD